MGRVPPAVGVTVSAVGLPVGFCTVRTESADVVVMIVVSAIADVPVARPVTVAGRSPPLRVRMSCPGWLTPTLNETRYAPGSLRLKDDGPSRVIPSPTAPSFGNSTSAPGATVAVLSGGMSA